MFTIHLIVILKHDNLPSDQHVLMSIARKLFMRFTMLVATWMISEMFFESAAKRSRHFIIDKIKKSFTITFGGSNLKMKWFFLMPNVSFIYSSYFMGIYASGIIQLNCYKLFSFYSVYFLLNLYFIDEWITLVNYVILHGINESMFDYLQHDSQLEAIYTTIKVWLFIKVILAQRTLN